MTEETPPKAEPKVEPKAEPKVEPKAEQISAEEAAKLRKALKDANAEAATRRKKLEAFEAAEDERKKAEMSEIDRLKLEAKEYEAENKKLKLSSEQHSIAEKVGLPIAFAKRIQGNTIEEMEADAQALFDALPVKPKVDPGTTNPGGAGGENGETPEQRKKRLFS